MVLVDLSFSAFYNLVSDYQPTYPTEYYIGKISSGIFISALTVNYIYMIYVAGHKPWKLGVNRTVMLVNNLWLESVKKSISVRKLNVLFRIKIMIFMACIVTL
jgi:hypothetical protein